MKKTRNHLWKCEGSQMARGGIGVLGIRLTLCVTYLQDLDPALVAWT